MMAVKAALSGSTLVSTFSTFSDHQNSPRNRGSFTTTTTRTPIDKNGHLTPFSPNTLASPNEIVDPSPIASSAGTDFADVEEIDEALERTNPQRASQLKSPTVKSPELKIETDRYPFQKRPGEEDPPQSVIHIPTGFGHFNNQSQPSPEEKADESKDFQTYSELRPDLFDLRATSSESIGSGVTIKSPVAMEVDSLHEGEHTDSGRGFDIVSPPHITTSLPPAPSDRGTPRAQTRQEVAALSRPGSSLASIREGEDTDLSFVDDTGDEQDPLERGINFFRDADAEINALKTALAECWTLCNTLASLSYIHRERIFNLSGKGDMQQYAWKSCWKLCQNLYDTRDEHTISYVRPTLDLCRDFCQALFEVRVRDNETADSVLRVSFELNNHLYNTHDRSLPEAFRERTLDFYITLCHRLMKQKSRLAEETDSLLRACWSLAEMLFSIRQNKREGKKADEELLSSAVQACWELCDLFREGWSRVRPERLTPRPSLTSFTQAFRQARQSGFTPADDNGNLKVFPETPTTIFEDTITNVSPDEAPTPNIFVLGGNLPNQTPSSAVSNPNPKIGSSRTTSVTRGRSMSASHHSSTSTSAAAVAARTKWSSTSSVHSQPASERSVSTQASSTHTVTTPAEDPTLTLLKTLFVRAAIATGRGYSRNSPDPTLNSLHAFVKTLPDTAFGTQTWQLSLMDNYKKAVAGDQGFRNLGPTYSLLAQSQGQGHSSQAEGAVGRSGGGPAGPIEVAKSVQGMVRCVYGFSYLKDLYRFVFGFYVEEALQGSVTGVPSPNSRAPNPGSVGGFGGVSGGDGMDREGVAARRLTDRI